MGNKKHLTLTEHLTANFYNWEKRGRGWQVWDFPVQVEPPFEPFFHATPQRSVTGRYLPKNLVRENYHQYSKII